MFASQKRYQDLSLQMVVMMEIRRIFTRDLQVAWGELSELEEGHYKYKEDHKEPMESARKAYALAYNKDVQLREKKEELAVAKAEITSLCDQLVHALSL